MYFFIFKNFLLLPNNVYRILYDINKKLEKNYISIGLIKNRKSYYIEKKYLGKVVKLEFNIKRKIIMIFISKKEDRNSFVSLKIYECNIVSSY